MKIAQVSHAFFPHMGGIESEAERLHQSLKEKGINTTIVTTDLNTPINKRKDYAIYNKTNFSFMGNPLSILFIKHFIKNKYDLIQLYSAWFLTSFFATFFRKDAKVFLIFPGVFPDKSNLIQTFFLNIYKPFAQYTLNKSTKVFVQSNSEKDKLIRHFKIKAEKIEVTYNGVNLENNRKRIKNNKKTILFTGRIIKDKNPDILIKAAAILKKEGYDFIIKFIGTIDEDYKDELIKLIKTLNVEDRILFIKNIPLEKRYLLMKECRSAFTSVGVGSWEGIPNRLIEVMQFGVPCVAYSSGRTAELIQDYKTGLLIKNLDEKELANKLSLLMKDKNLYKKLGIEAKNIVERKFNWNNSFNKIWDNYKK